MAHDDIRKDSLKMLALHLERQFRPPHSHCLWKRAAEMVAMDERVREVFAPIPKRPRSGVNPRTGKPRQARIATNPAPVLRRLRKELLAAVGGDQARYEEALDEFALLYERIERALNTLDKSHDDQSAQARSGNARS